MIKKHYQPSAKTFFLSVNGPNPLQRVHRPGAYGRSMHQSVPNDRFIDPRSTLSKSCFVTLNITSHFKSCNSPHCTHKSLYVKQLTTLNTLICTLKMTWLFQFHNLLFGKWHCIFNVAAHQFYTLISSLNTTSCFQSGDKNVFKKCPLQPTIERNSYWFKLCEM